MQATDWPITSASIQRLTPSSTDRPRQRGKDEAHDADGRAQRQPHPQLVLENPPPIFERHVADRQGPRDQRRRLGSGVAARRDAQRNERGQHDDCVEIAASKWFIADVTSTASATKKPAR